MKKYIVYVLTVIWLVTAYSSPVSAASKSLSDLQKDKKEVSSEIKDTQSQLNSTQAEMAKVDAEIRELDEKLTISADELETIKQTLSETVENQQRMEQELEQAREERDSQMTTFKKRLRYMHENGSYSYLEIVLQAKSIHDLLIRIEIMNIVARYDQQMADRLKESEVHISDKVEEIARQKNTIEALQYMQTVKMDAMQVALEDRQTYFEQLDADEQRYQAKLDQQKEDEKNIQEAIKKKEAEEARLREQQRATVTYNGIMKWPVPNYKRISDTYRQRINPVNKKSEFHTGVDIAAAMGSDILAAESGEVILAKYNGGYGNCVIISHGGGISTLYGHSSKLLVSVGQQVNKGDVIAKVGSTGVSTGPHLHFEVRINGNHTNPKAYLNY